MHHLGNALVWASIAGLAVCIMAGRAWAGNPVAVLVFLVAAAGWLLQGQWLPGVFSLFWAALASCAAFVRWRRHGRW